MTSKRFWFLVITGVILWAFFQVVRYLGNEGVRVMTEPKTKLTTEERTNAVNACASEGMSKEICGCIVDTITARYSLAEMQKMSPESPEAQNVVKECAQSELRPAKTI